MQPHIRVSDVERDRVSEILREHYAAGRLNHDEMNTRVGAAQSAVNWADLYGLLADLPVIPGMTLQPAAPPPGYAPHIPPGYPGPPPRKPGAPYSTAAWVCFGLGFFTLGTAWLPALIFAALASSANRAAEPKESKLARHPGPFILGTLLVVVATVAGGISMFSAAQPRHEVAIEVTGESGGKVFSVRTGIDGDERSTTARLPYEKSWPVRGSIDDLDLQVDSIDGKRAPSDLACRIKLDGEVVAEGSIYENSCQARWEED
ncbi:DUF1707 domain-containing protein [Spongiactinospora sp. TRM90649]|uniref:DUF1707 SHOCT-like domain-containing protein n=1 Tax=Spongiactinospora sp. TRM90649 TaxID=3031114 RepID=UPI0023F9C18F|nr:DUF1707 domain-containing protein [Spongiactinospora sp. TRM90649]MDF5756421.1 DUF1707 domain-containing protein [Spongiactinospora sp. TRM90649]